MPCVLAGICLSAGIVRAQDLPALDAIDICQGIDPCSGSLDPVCAQSSETTRLERRRAVAQCLADQSAAYRLAASEWARLDMAAREECLGRFGRSRSYTALSGCVSEKLAEKDAAPIN